MIDCECRNWCRAATIDLIGLDEHHSRCEKYETEKRARLFYYEEAEDAWVPAPDKVENIVDVTNLDNGDRTEIMFKCVFYSGSEMAALPES